MKTKFRKFITAILILCIITTLTACNDIRNSQKWVLTHEKWTSYDGTIQQDSFYEYDTSGKLIGETLDYGVDGVYTCSEFKYDNSGNVIEKTELYNNRLTDDETIYYYTYTYNDNGTLSKEISKSSTEEFITEYTYDNKGNVIKEIFKDSSGEESIYTYILEYEKDLCIQCEGTIKSTGYDDEYILKQYKYDKNGNKEYELYYNAFDESDDENNTTEVNGKRYKLFITKTYTYEKLSDVAIELETNNNESHMSSNTQDSNETEEVKLSDNCDKILASGYDANSNYYELVANEKEDYSGTKIEMGIIKNNEWVIPLTSNSPFVSESGLLIGARGVFKGSIYEERFAIFNYIGAGSFCYESIVWNSNTKETYIPDGTLEIKGTKPFVNNDGLFIISKYDENFKLLDVNTMTTKEINLRRSFSNGIDYCFPYSEGLFACMDYSSDSKANGFYDISGNKIIDLSKYQLAKNTYTTSNTGGYSGPKQNLVFENGKCTFTITNDQGSDYVITIDKTGNVINSVAK